MLLILCLGAFTDKIRICEHEQVNAHELYLGEFSIGYF